MECGNSYLVLGISDIDRDNSIAEFLEGWNKTIILPADHGGLTSMESWRGSGLGDLEKTSEELEKYFLQHTKTVASAGEAASRRVTKISKNIVEGGDAWI